MCGIIGYVGNKKALPILVEGLRRLEYRGYDSAGFSVIEDKKIITIKSVGKVVSLENKITEKEINGTLGIAHTRWATHGKPSDINSHPHEDCVGAVSIVHNGIIENYQELKKILIEKGHVFKSETDSEVIAHLIEEFKKKNSFENSFIETMKIIKGTYGIAAISSDEPDKIIVAKMGSPLILGVGKEECVIASDASAILQHTKEVIYLEDGELAILTREGYEIFNLSDKTKLEKQTSIIDWSPEMAQKNGFPFFMLKEIFEQPESIKNALGGRILKGEGKVVLGGLKDVADRLREIKELVIVSCGTSYYAGLVGKYMIEEYAGIPVQVEYASEFRYKKPLISEKTAVLAISQSGETIDTLMAIKEAKEKGALTLGIVNVVGSTIARETDAGVYNHAGPEIGVASTKAFTSQLSILALITIFLGRQRNMSLVMGERISEELEKIPELIKKVLENSDEIKKIAEKYSDFKDILFLGRKYNYPVAMEGALKVKEISYIHAEAYPTGEMKHGPLALIDENFPSIFIVPKDSVYEKNISGMQEIKARNGRVIAITTEGDEEVKKIADDIIYIPKTLEMLTPILSVLVLQLLAYYVAVSKGRDVDKPRNLAKSVTVE